VRRASGSARVSACFREVGSDAPWYPPCLDRARLARAEPCNHEDSHSPGPGGKGCVVRCRVAAFLVAAAVAAFVPSTAAAQEPAAGLTVTRDHAVALAAFAQPVSLDLRQLDFRTPDVVERSGSSRLVTSLMISTIVVQALDVHSTYQALGAGAVEANPVMAPLAGNRAAFVATKAAVTTATVLAAHHLARRNKVAAIVALVAINSAYAFVIDHNYRVARGLR
jgi:hypothetical protein